MNSYARFKALTTFFLALSIFGWFVDVLQAPRVKGFMAEVLINVLQSVTTAGIQQFIDQLVASII